MIRHSSEAQGKRKESKGSDSKLCHRRDVTATKRCTINQSNTYYIEQSTGRNEKINLQIKQHLFRDSPSFCAASDDVYRFKRDNNLELTRWTWLQADSAHICVGIVEVAACEAPTTLSNRRVECLRPRKPTLGGPALSWTGA